MLSCAVLCWTVSVSQASSPLPYLQAHPDVYKHMIKLGWDKKPGVNVVFGRWQDVIEKVCSLLPGVFVKVHASFRCLARACTVRMFAA